MTSASASRLDGGKLSTYSDALGKALLGCFFSGDSDRGGVFADEARRPLNINLFSMASFCRLPSMRYAMELRQQAIPSHIKFSS
jgi:hypothetical protein